MKAFYVCLLVMLVVGCAPKERIPRYDLMPADRTLQMLRERSASIKTVTTVGDVRLTSADGQSVMFDSALVLELPGKARLRAWKFGQAVFDLTVLPSEVYLLAPEGSSHREQIAQAGGNASAMIRKWMTMLSGNLSSDRASEHGNELRIDEGSKDGTQLLCIIDRPTLTVRQYRLVDAQNKELFSLDLSQYVESSGNVWPSRIVAKSRDGEIRISLRDIEINGQVSEVAFRPPSRAEKLP